MTKAKECSILSIALIWERAAPNLVSEASTFTMNCQPGSELHSTGGGGGQYLELFKAVSVLGPGKGTKREHELGQGFCHSALARDESSVEIGEAQELLKLLPASQRWPLSH